MNKPKLRFKADDGSQFPDWEEKKFYEVIKLYRGSSPRPIVEYIVDDNQGLNWIKISDVPQNGNVIVTVKEHISKEGAKKSRAVYKGEIILSNSMSFGKPCILGIDGFIHDGWFVVREYEKHLNKWYLCQFLDSDIMYKQYRKLAAGGVVLNISSEIVNSTKIPVPSLPEQQKIAEFLSTVDTVIEKQKETVSAWEERKKGVMQKLFSQEVRFKADDGSDFPEWEEKSYLSICNVFADGDWIESKDQSDSGIRLIQTGNIGNGIFIDKDDKKKYISKETFDRLKCNEVFEGDILISRLPSPAGRACIVPKLNERMITAVDCTIVRTDKSIISHDYCVQFMQSSKHFYYVASMMAGGTRQRISRKNLEDELISVPCLAEQQKIADCLLSLDDVIKKQKATLTAWKELKKGLLQQMFV